MATLDDVAALAGELPEVTEAERHGARAWAVAGKVFAWERRFSKADVKRYGDRPVPPDPILAVRVEDLGEKEAVLAAGHAGFFTIPHFDGYAAVLVELAAAAPAPLRDVLVDGWLACAPPALAAAFTRGDAAT
ncbi:MmcQ/YjbR family DNA-binding protein [Dactylosporangium sp. NPDC005572]|uniref:MmcQ/YjbR family DNA-binding protein n=1 Tax=Dactylosporangium sp. NPDC005572 TaxID=3156889 RepID=UPI0033B7D266